MSRFHRVKMLAVLNTSRTAIHHFHVIRWASQSAACSSWSAPLKRWGRAPGLMSLGFLIPTLHCRLISVLFGVSATNRDQTGGSHNAINDSLKTPRTLPTAIYTQTSVPASLCSAGAPRAPSREPPRGCQTERERFLHLLHNSRQDN